MDKRNKLVKEICWRSVYMYKWLKTILLNLEKQREAKVEWSQNRQKALHFASADKSSYEGSKFLIEPRYKKQVGVITLSYEEKWKKIQESIDLEK